MSRDGIDTKWVSVYSYDVFRVVFGLIILIVDLYIYLTYYYSFEGKDDLGLILTIMLVVGLISLMNGMDSWRKRDKDIQKVERIKRKVTYEKKKNELKELKIKK